MVQRLQYVDPELLAAKSPAYFDCQHVLQLMVTNGLAKKRHGKTGQRIDLEVVLDEAAPAVTCQLQ